MHIGYDREPATMMRRRRSRRGAQDGQGLVEFALVLPIFFLAVFGLLDVGRLVYFNAALSQAAREGARLAATEAASIGSTAPGCVASESDIGPGNPGAHVCPATVADLRAHVTAAVNRMTVALGPVSQVHISCNDGTVGDPAPSDAWTAPGGGGNGCQDAGGVPLGATGELVSVRVEYPYAAITPVINSLIGSVALSGSATMVVH